MYRRPALHWGVMLAVSPPTGYCSCILPLLIPQHSPFYTHSPRLLGLYPSNTTPCLFCDSGYEVTWITSPCLIDFIISVLFYLSIWSPVF